VPFFRVPADGIIGYWRLANRHHSVSMSTRTTLMPTVRSSCRILKRWSDGRHGCRQLSVAQRPWTGASPLKFGRSAMGQTRKIRACPLHVRFTPLQEPTSAPPAATSN